MSEMQAFSLEHLIEDIRLVGNYDIEGLRDELRGWEDSLNSARANENPQLMRYARAMIQAISELIALKNAQEKAEQAKQEISMAGHKLGQVIGRYSNSLTANEFKGNSNGNV